MTGAGVAQCTCSVRERQGQLCLTPNCNSAVNPMGCLDCIWERTCGARMGVANGRLIYDLICVERLLYSRWIMTMWHLKCLMHI